MLYLTPYILLPLLLSFIWKKLHLKWSGLNMLITAGLIAMYPFLLFKLDAYYHPPDPDTAGCGMFNAVIIMANFVVLLPFSLGMQLFFNFLFLHKNKRKQRNDLPGQ